MFGFLRLAAASFIFSSVFCSWFTGPAAGVALAADESKPVVVFLDFNLSDREVKAARDAATELKVQLRVLPVVPGEDRKNIQTVRTQLKRLQAEYAEMSEKVVQNRQKPYLFSFIARWNYEEKAQEIARQTKQLESKIQFYEEKYGLSEAALRLAFRRMSHSGEYLQGLILSGHSRGDQFWGTIGEKSILNRDRIFSVLQDYPKFTAKLRSVYLWGCYGGTYESILAWSRAFPQVKNIFGFTGSAPANLAFASYDGLKGLMLSEPQLVSDMPPEAVQRWLAKQSALKETLFLARTWDWWIGVQEPILSFRSLRVDCEKAGVTLGPAISTFQKYFEAQELGFETPPHEKDFHAQGRVSKLREAYGAFQRHFICSEEIPDMPDRAVVIALIHYEQVQQNFSRARYLEIQRWNAVVQRLDPARADILAVPKGLSFGVVTRKDFLAWSGQVLAWLEDYSERNLTGIRRDKTIREDYRFLEDFYNQHLAPELDQLDGIPPTWMTE